MEGRAWRGGQLHSQLMGVAGLRQSAGRLNHQQCVFTACRPPSNGERNN